MPLTSEYLLKVLIHAMLEAMGIGVRCLALTCTHNHFTGRLAPLNRIVHSSAYRLAVQTIFILVTAALTVALLDSGHDHGGT